MRLALTGAGGGLGRAIAERLPAQHELVAFRREELPVDDMHAVLQRLVPAAPDLIVHAAAMTSVDGCELDPTAAYRANALGARNVALAAARAGALMLHVSTDYVFDGEKGEPYHEFDEPNPLSVYGRSKLAGEREVAAHAPEHLVLRTSWVFGGGKDFLTSALGRLAAGETVPALVDLVGTPTFVGHLAERLLQAARSGQRGVLHLGGPEALTWHDVLVRAKAELGLPGEVGEQKSGDLDRPARRPAASALTSLVAQGLTIDPMPPLEAALRELWEAIRGGA